MTTSSRRRFASIWMVIPSVLAGCARAAQPRSYAQGGFQQPQNPPGSKRIVAAALGNRRRSGSVRP